MRTPKYRVYIKHWGDLNDEAGCQSYLEVPERVQVVRRTITTTVEAVILN